MHNFPHIFGNTRTPEIDVKTWCRYTRIVYPLTRKVSKGNVYSRLDKRLWYTDKNHAVRHRNENWIDEKTYSKKKKWLKFAMQNEYTDLNFSH